MGKAWYRQEVALKSATTCSFAVVQLGRLPQILAAHINVAPHRFLIWGMGSGLVKRCHDDASLGLMGIPTNAEGGKKETLRGQQEKTSKLRAKGKSMLHVSLLILQNPNIKRKAYIVYFALRAMR